MTMKTKTMKNMRMIIFGKNLKQNEISPLN